MSIVCGEGEHNIGSIKVLEKNGFVKSIQEMPEGVLLYELKLVY